MGMGPCTRTFSLPSALREVLPLKSPLPLRPRSARCYFAAARTTQHISPRRVNWTPPVTALSCFATRVMSPVYFPAVTTRAMHSRTLKHRAFVALGSNMGDRIAWIEQACNAMEKHGDIKILRTSSLWETQAMYVLDQNSFVNGACEIETSLGPIELLDRLQSVENELGRVKVIDKGPRNIDLDILLYDQETISTERLQVPHKLMLEREFVLRPLCELIPNESLPGHSSNDTLQKHLEALPLPPQPLSTITPLANGLPPIASLHNHRRTQIMSILNMTPDSFSDGGLHSHKDLIALKKSILFHVNSGANILDIGGQSTKPDAVLISPEEELSRILPAIQLIRSLPEASNVAISIDTFYSEVAEAAINAGAHIINDVSGGLLDDKMLSTVARLGCTLCIMHMRGTPQTMNSLTSYPDGLVPTVARELLERLRAAEEAGVRRWRIILDPGLGFAKNQQQNVELLRRLSELRDHEGLRGFPWLVGPSRKRFVGTITGVKEAKDRTWGTAAAVSAAVQGGADIVRVHDVDEMTKVVKMADAVWRF